MDRRTNDRQTGPWVLALGVLAIGVGALANEVRKRRRERGTASETDA
ncbi:hypothetical protein [Haladaptatus sp. CMAA 1911]